MRCPHCQRWHAVIAGHTEGTDYTVRMRYFECRGLRYYAGQQGQVSRHPIRPGAASRPLLRLRWARENELAGRLLKGWNTPLEVPIGRSTRGGRT